VRAVLRRKLIGVSTFIKKLERYHISNLTTHLRALEQKEANPPKRSRQQEIIKFRAKIKLETKRIIQRINKRKSRLFEKINKTYKPLAKITKRQRDSMQIHKIRKGRQNRH
jgi:DNA anti-recombination protein RmuC